jgi:ATP synthase protein I
MVTIPTQNQAEQTQNPGLQPRDGSNGQTLKNANPWSDDDLFAELEAEEQSFKPLTRVEAERIRAANPQASVMRIVGVQILTSVVLAGLVFLLARQASLGWSVFYGGVAVWVPAAMFARGLQRQKASGDAGSALMGFFVWELVKVVMTVALLLAAPRLVSELNWLALLAGFVVTMKVYWVAMWLHLVRKNSVSKAVNKTAQKNG